MRVKINNITWDIGLGDQKSHDWEEYSLCGVTVRSKNKIYINKNLQKDLFRRTIIHELTHAYIWSYGLNQVESFKEENICDFLESHGDSIIGTANCVYNDLLKHLDDYCEIDMESFNDTNSKGIDKGLK